MCGLAVTSEAHGRYGYWCEGQYGQFINKLDFDLHELTAAQTHAFRRLLERTLTEEQRSLGCAAWHHVCPPSDAD